MASEKKTGKTAEKSTARKTNKRVNVELAPGVYRLLKAKRDAINAAPDRAGPPASYADLLNKALDDFLPSPPAEAKAQGKE
jgi:hypothetical protein